jgi:hypothetical protein
MEPSQQQVPQGTEKEQVDKHVQYEPSKLRCCSRSIVVTMIRKQEGEQGMGCTQWCAGRSLHADQPSDQIRMQRTPTQRIGCHLPALELRCKQTMIAIAHGEEVQQNQARAWTFINCMTKVAQPTMGTGYVHCNRNNESG